MPTLTVTEDRLREVDKFAEKEERSREEIVNEAIDAYLRKKALAELRGLGRELAAAGITEDDVRAAIKEVRAERKPQGNLL